MITIIVHVIIITTIIIVAFSKSRLTSPVASGDSILEAKPCALAGLRVTQDMDCPDCRCCPSWMAHCKATDSVDPTNLADAADAEDGGNEE